MSFLRGAALLLGAGVLSICSTAARAIYLDDEQQVSFRARIYSQASIRTENSQTDTTPEVKAGQLVQHRNFYNPELDARLTNFTTWMKGGVLDWLAPDDLHFRMAAWGFYDGIYDYGTSQFDRVQENFNPNFGNYNRGICSQGPDQGAPCSSNLDCASPGVCMPAGAWFLEGPTINLPSDCPANPDACFVDSVKDLFPGYELQTPIDIYQNQRRINELYLSYNNGPLFVRIGKQSISWGESDTIALLDQNNPFDLTLGAPGIFQDVEEARIPLYSVRSSLALFDALGPFSSGSIEAYWVPGDLDVNTGILPLLTASPYSPPGQNPQFSSGFPNETHQFILFDHIPKKRFENSRYGVRLQTVLNGEYTLQAWMYTHFPQSPVPRHVAPAIVRPGTSGARTAQPICGEFSQQGCSPLFVVETVHDLTTVYGAAATFFVSPPLPGDMRGLLDGILRLEAELFENEPGFIPQFNLNIKSAEDAERGIGIPGADPVQDPGTVPVSDILRWEVGFDRFFFFRPLNPTNSFTMVVSQVGAWNLDETGRKDFRYSGQRKQGHDIPGRNPEPDDFVQQKEVEAFTQLTLLTDYLHGRLSPQFTWIQNVRGTYILHPQLTYRWTDWLLFRLELVHIGGEFEGPGFFRDRDQASLRVTYQLN